MKLVCVWRVGDKPYKNSRTLEDRQLPRVSVGGSPHQCSFGGAVWGMLGQPLQSKEHVITSCTSLHSEGSTVPGRLLQAEVSIFYT